MKILLIVMFFPLFIYSQSFELKTNKTALDIKIPPPDTVAPQLYFSLPEKMEGFPVYSKDTIFTLQGNVKDNNNKTIISINNKDYGTFSNGSFKIDIGLKYGENKLLIKAIDRKDNIKSENLTVFQDPQADINPPIIKINKQIMNPDRGIKIVKKKDLINNRLVINVKITDESGILAIWMNDIKIDSLINDEFTYDFGNSNPDSINIKAIDLYGNIARATFGNIQENKKGYGEFSVGDYYALIIGVEDYIDPSLPDLEYPVKDCNELENILITNYTFPKNNVVFLKNPTRESIINSLQNFRKKLNDNDNLLIFYAGHGVWDPDIQQGYWLPIDASRDNPSNWIPNSTIRDYIRGIKTKHTLLIADACFSGSIFTGRDVFLNSDASIQETYKYPSRKAITSGMLETVLDKSVFIKFLLKRLSENKEKFYQSMNLYVGIKDAVINNSPNNQKPLYGVIQGAGDEGIGDFIFIKKE